MADMKGRICMRCIQRALRAEEEHGNHNLSLVNWNDVTHPNELGCRWVQFTPLEVEELIKKMKKAKMRTTSSTVMRILYKIHFKDLKVDLS